MLTHRKRRGDLAVAVNVNVTTEICILLRPLFDGSPEPLGSGSVPETIVQL